MLNRLIKEAWDLDSFIKEVQHKYPNTFTKAALEVIFEYLEEYDENYELDVIEICGDYIEVL